MTKEVLLNISGLQIEDFGEEEVDNEPIEVVTPANYFWKGGKHYILYDEVTEGVPGVTKNKIKLTGSDSIEITKRGAVNVQMFFEKNKKNVTYYETPYGQLLLGINTIGLAVEVGEDNIDVRIEYELDMNHEPLADCKIRMNIQSKNAGGFTITNSMEQ